MRILYRTTREVTKAECDWLDHDVPAGTTCVKYMGPTYGCINWAKGTAVIFDEGGTFFEFPHDALEVAT